MDKETLSNYGWIVICVLVLAVMLAFATPFGTFVADAVKSTTQGLFDVNQGALDAAGIEIMQQEFEGMLNGGSGGAETPVTPVAYEIIEGAGQTVATEDASFRSTADYDKFDSVKVDNNVVDPSNYTVSEGSTIILLDGEYLATLSNGTHTLEVVSNDGSASCEFTVNIVSEPVAPAPLVGSATFGDGVTLSWEELKLEENGIKYRYNAKAISDKSIGNSAFKGCYNYPGLTSIVIPEGVTSIGNAAFETCIDLISVTIPDGVTSIGNDAFYNTGITSINIPNSVTSIGNDAFEFSDLTSIVIPESVTCIGHWAFAYCTNLTDVTISNSVTSIGSRAFKACPNLTSISYTGTKIQWNAISVCDNWYKDTPVTKVICSNGTISLS